MEEKKEFLFKVLLIGDVGTGKTSIMKRYVHQYFSTIYKTTVSFTLRSLLATNTVQTKH
jgi:GTPase SAR1 family protein